jgi:hypothetical protein
MAVPRIVSEPWTRVFPVAQVISLQEHRDRRDPLRAATMRLDEAVRRLDPLVRRPGIRLGRAVERELTAIASAVSRGVPAEAARLAERLADRLEHPAALG